MVATNSPYSFNNFSLSFQQLLLILLLFSPIIFGIVVNNVYFAAMNKSLTALSRVSMAIAMLLYP